MLGTLMWPYFSRTLPVSSQPEISTHQELSEDAQQDTELFAPPRPGTDQSVANCTLPYTGNMCIHSSLHKHQVAAATDCITDKLCCPE